MVRNLTTIDKPLIICVKGHRPVNYWKLGYEGFSLSPQTVCSLSLWCKAANWFWQNGKGQFILIRPMITTTTSLTTSCPKADKRGKVKVPFDVSHTVAQRAYKRGSQQWWLRVQMLMRGTMNTLHYILSKGAMNCMPGFVSVHVSPHGIPGSRCCYKVLANEFCQR